MKAIRTAQLILWSALTATFATPQAGQGGQTANGATNQSGQPGERSASTSASPSQQEINNAKSQGLVWVNTSTHAYHKGGTTYGKTKHGKFMTEADARQHGYKEAKEPPTGNPIPHSKDQSGIDSTAATHNSTPPKQ